MKGAVDSSIVLSSESNDITHLAEIRDIPLSDQQSAGDGSNLKQLSKPLFVDIGLVGIVQSSFPARFRWQTQNVSQERGER